MTAARLQKYNTRTLSGERVINGHRLIVSAWNSRKTQVRAYTAVVRRQRLRLPVENVVKGGSAEVVQEAAGMDAVLRQMGKPAKQMSSAIQDGLADLSVHRRADRYTDEAARFPVSERDQLTATVNVLSRPKRNPPDADGRTDGDEYQP